MRADFDRGKIKAFQSGVEVRAAMKFLSEEILTEAKGLAPVDTGHLKNSGFAEQAGTDARVGFTADYSRYVEFGTAPHEISAKPGGFLRFAGRSGVVFARRVNHPGTRAQPFLRPAALRRRD